MFIDNMRSMISSKSQSIVKLSEIDKKKSCELIKKNQEINLQIT